MGFLLGGNMFEIKKEKFSEKEVETQQFWESKEIFKKCIELRKDAPLFSFYDGPPFATGLPHYGHLLAGTIKDAVQRYKTMKGFFVSRRFGWDCHGLPVENEIEKAKELSGAPSIQAYGIGNFNEECRKIVLRYSTEWKRTVERMGRWVDFSKTYRTMDLSYMESVWWVFGELWKKGLVYQGFKVMPFSAKLGTPLSNFEANLNYKDVDDPSLTLSFPVKGEKDLYLLAWTTTPWTLISNLALTVNADLDYVKVKSDGKTYILSKNRVGIYFKEGFEIVEEFKGAKLKDVSYEPLFDYFTDTKGAFRVLADDFVGEEDGTGIVHTAPAFGESDFFVCAREGIELVCPVDQNGKFTKEVPEYEGQFIKDADKAIIRALKEKGLVFHHATINHRYPFCWRSDTPLIYKAVKTWFVGVEEIKEKLLTANKKIEWTPAHIKEGRFGKWLGAARDWAISRNRYWGTPIPIWQTEDGEMHVISSREELEKLTGKPIDDLHRHFIDDLTFEKEGKVYRRIPEVFDCWFESGSMPYAQNHYPFANKEATMKAFPADFIVEGLDQTRGWFYTLTILAAALFDKPAFKNVVVNGIILAEDGNKMSKRLKNYPEPHLVIDKHGADAIRLYLLSSGAVQAEDMRFSERGVEITLRQVLIPLWNSYVFLATYCKIYNWDPELFTKEKPSADIDRWILSMLSTLCKEVEEGMDEYALSRAVEPFVDFIDQLTNWYIRRNRSRFWADEDTKGRREAFATLYTVLFTLTKVASPFIPFLSESIYQQLRTSEDPASVHMCDFPAAQEFFRDEALEKQMATVQSAVSMGHSLRKESKVKVRQPLKVVHIAAADPGMLGILREQSKLIEEELNVKGVQYHADETQFVTYRAKANFKTLGRKAGKNMNRIKQMIEAFTSEQIEHLQKEKSLPLDLDGEEFHLEEADVLLDRDVKEGLIAQSGNGITLALELTLDANLIEEGLAREIVNKINTMRRDLDFEVQDRIIVTIDSTSAVKNAFEAHMDYISREVLAKEVHFSTCSGTKWDLNEHPATIFIERV